MTVAPMSVDDLPVYGRPLSLVAYWSPDAQLATSGVSPWTASQLFVNCG